MRFSSIIKMIEVDHKVPGRGFTAQPNAQFDRFTIPFLLCHCNVIKNRHDCDVVCNFFFICIKFLKVHGFDDFSIYCEFEFRVFRISGRRGFQPPMLKSAVPHLLLLVLRKLVRSGIRSRSVINFSPFFRSWQIANRPILYKQLLNLLFHIFLQINLPLYAPQILLE